MAKFNPKNALVVEAIKAGKAYATAESSTSSPYFTFMGKCIIAYHEAEDTGLADGKAFDVLIGLTGISKQERNKMWTITQVGDLTCAPALVKRFGEMKPSKTGLLYACQALRHTGWFSKNGDLSSKAIKVADKQEAAPSADVLQKAIDAANKRSNKGRGDSEPKTLKQIVEAQLKALKKHINGFTRDKKAVPGNNDPLLLDIVKAQMIFLSPKNVRSMNAREIEKRMRAMLAEKEAA